MRPDAHKKKASTAYKKKHGMSSDKKVPAADVGHRSKPKETPPGGKASSARDPATRESSDVEPSSEVTFSQLGVGDKSFKRRHVQSNWDRYEGLDEGDDNHITQRGADFNLLINVASNPHSQFRFSDEQDWDNAPSDAGGVLSIDCLSLAASLQCIPMHTRLGISEDHFTTNQLELFKTSAERHLKSYGEQLKDTVKSSPDKVQVDIWENEEEELEPDNPVVTEPAYSLAQKAPDVVALEGINQSKLNDEPSVKLESNPTDHKRVKTKGSVAQEAKDHMSAPMAVAKDRCSQGVGIEEDLDMLLGLDSSVTLQKETVLDDLLDEDPMKSSSELDSHDVSKSAANPVNIPSSTTNLEDWLDDLLDD